MTFTRAPRGFFTVSEPYKESVPHAPAWPWAPGGGFSSCFHRVTVSALGMLTNKMVYHTAKKSYVLWLSELSARGAEEQR